MNRQAHLATIAKEILIDQQEIDNFQLPDESAFIKPASAFCEELIKSKHSTEEIGSPLPWTKTLSRVRLRKGELSYWAGYKGHKKSMMTSQVALDLILQNKSVCIASFEMNPIDTLDRMASQCMGNQNPPDDMIRNFIHAAAKNLYLYDQQGSVKTERVIRMVEYCAYKLGIEHIFVDSMMKCGMSTDDYTAQKNFCNRLDTIARDTGSHVHLILHMRKPPIDKRYIPDGYDIAGGNDITNQACNIFIVWTDMEKKEEMEKPESERNYDITKRYDMVLRVANQRHGKYEGKLGFYFDERSLQFTECEGGRKDYARKMLELGNG